MADSTVTNLPKITSLAAADEFYVVEDPNVSSGITWANVEASIDHGSITGLGDADHSAYVNKDGTTALTNDWDVGPRTITALIFVSDQTTGTPPLTVASTTEVTNLNAATAGDADTVDGIEAAAFGQLASANVWTALNTFTSVPTGSGVGQGSLYVNPAAADADRTLFGVALNGSSRLRVDEDGDVTAAGAIFADWVQSTNAVVALNGNLRFQDAASGSRSQIENRVLNGLQIGGRGATTASWHIVEMGMGSWSQITLGGNLDQNTVLIRRNISGASTYSEDGYLLKMERAVSDVSAESGGYFACDSVLAVDKTGLIACAGVKLSDNKELSLGTSSDARIDWSTAQATAETLVLGLGDTAMSLIVTRSGYRDQDFDHAAQSNPTLFIHSDEDPDTDNDEWISFSHDQTDGHIGLGTGVLNVGGGLTAGDGGSTNYAAFAADGTLSLLGTARADYHVVLTNADLGKGATAATQVIVGDFTVWEFGINDDAVLDWELPSNWAPGTDVVIHIHWQINEAYVTNSGEVQWEFDWAACPNDGSEPLDGPTHTGTLDAGDADIHATARHLVDTTIGTISGASLTAADSIGLTLKRIALDDGSDPSAEPGICHVEIHYTIDGFGE